MSRRWCQDTCPRCGCPSQNPVVREDGGVVRVFHLDRNGHAWKVEFIAEMVA